jgi:hypothetical protein
MGKIAAQAVDDWCQHLRHMADAPDRPAAHTRSSPGEGTGLARGCDNPSSAASRCGRHPSRWANGETDPLEH